MGRYAGWIAIAAGISSGADVILIPEIPYHLQRIVAAVRKRRANGVSFTLVVVAEGAKPEGGDVSVEQPGDPTRQEKLGGAAERLAMALRREQQDSEVRVTVLGHVQRGGTPSAFDRLLATRYGTAAVDLIQGGGSGRMVTLRGTQISSVTFGEACEKLRLVDPAGDMVRSARATGVEMG
jgi:ATP-dependent phosphofructokinase / diphosphate-dependent phosphofructokinase